MAARHPAGAGAAASKVEPAHRPGPCILRGSAPGASLQDDGDGESTAPAEAMSRPMIPSERGDYSAIVDRPPLKLPNDARICSGPSSTSRSGTSRADGAAGAPGADRAGAAARRAELELARIRDAGRRLALLRAVQAARHQAHARHQRPRLRGLSARRRAGQERRLGVHGPRLRPGPDPQGRRPGGDDQPLDGRDREVHRHAPGRLARAGPDPDAGDAGASGRGRRAIYRRLGL